MSSSHYSARARRIGLALSHFRRQAGMTLDEAAEEISSTKSTISRMEHGKTVSRPAMIRALLMRYGATGEELAALTKLAKEASRPGWWRSYVDILPSKHLDTIALEDEATRISTYEPTLIPGLLQTADYVRQVMRDGIFPLADEEVERRVEARLVRQKILTAERPLELCAIIDEAALRRPVGGASVMSEQLKTLVKLSELPQLSLQVMPLSAGAHAGVDSNMTILEFEDPTDPAIVAVNTSPGVLLIDKPADVRLSQRIFDELRTIALAPVESIAMIKEIRAHEYR